MANQSEELLDVAGQVLDLAKSAGADAADTNLGRVTEFEVKVADGEIVTLTQATSKGLGLRVFVGKRMGFCTTSDFNADNLKNAVERAVALGREAADDPHHGLPPQAEPGRIDAGDLVDLYDPKVPALSADEKIQWAHDLESAARAADPRVTKFRDSGVETNELLGVLVSSTGAVRTIQSTGISLWSNPIAEQNGELQTEVWYDSRTHQDDLESVASVGRTAGERAARMLGAKPVPSQDVPVVFEPHLAAGLMAGMLGALDGDMVFKKASFLAGKLDEVIATDRLTVVDDPHLERGTGSMPFDGEGLPTYAKRVVDAGRLTTFLYDSYSARKAGVKPTANARRSYASLPHTGAFNFYVQAGEADPEQIVRSVDKGLLVTRGLGHGVNTVSGEYSRGANGLWIEKGEVIHPVQEVTIAGDFLELLKRVDAVGTDLQMRGSYGAPTLRISPMTVAGS